MKTRHITRRSFVQASSGGLTGAVFNFQPGSLSAAEQEGELLYNGIRLPAVWPPRVDQLTREPMRVPYLDNPPAVIPIDVGRQLLFDNFLIEHTTLERKFHSATIHPASPVIRPEPKKYPWEKGEEIATAMSFSDGVWYEPKDRRYRLWYMGGFRKAVTCYAESDDGIKWKKPNLDVRAGTNIVQELDRDSTTVWLDKFESDPAKRFKMSAVLVEEPTSRQWKMKLYYSPDGIHWSSEVATSGPCGDRSTFFYNPFRKRWVYSLRSNFPGLGRCRRYWENTDLARGAVWTEGQPTLWVGADRSDPPDPAEADVQAQLYTLDAVAYESVLLGAFSVMRGKKRKGNTVVLGFSRDGFHWDRPDRSHFIGTSPQRGDWNHDYLHLAGGCCLIVGDELRFYVAGRSDDYTNPDAMRSTGLATLRRDGFASMNAGTQAGTLTTRPVRFQGKHLFVNAAAKSGELHAEVLDEKGNVVEPFSKASCAPVTVDKTLVEVRWRGSENLSTLRGKPVRFRFSLKNASFYAFWVSPDKSGASMGYVAAGGPGFAGPVDTVGRGSYEST